MWGQTKLILNLCLPVMASLVLGLLVYALCACFRQDLTQTSCVTRVTLNFELPASGLMVGQLSCWSLLTAIASFPSLCNFEKLKEKDHGHFTQTQKFWVFLFLFFFSSSLLLWWWVFCSEGLAQECMLP